MQFVVFVDVDLGEERLVAQATVGVVAAVVDVSAVGQQVQCVVEVGPGVGVLAVVGGNAPVDLVKFSKDAVLFSFEQSKRDRVGVVGLQEPFLLVLEAVAVGGELGKFVDFGGHELVELVVQNPGERFVLGGVDLDALVVVLDQFLDIGDEDRTAIAVGALGVPPGADEVAVDVAVPVLRVGHDQPGPASSAVDGAFEVVVVDLRGLGRRFVSGEDGLDLVPDLGGYEGLMGSLVVDAAVCHVALVVGVGQQSVHRGHGHLLGGAFRGGQAHQAAGGEFVVELADGPAP